MKTELEAMYGQWLKVRVSYKTEQSAIEAVKRNGDALQYVKDQSEAVCLEAVKQDGYALRYVKDQSEAVCLEAVKQNGYALQYVKDQSEAVCLEAVKQNGYALQYVEDRWFEHLAAENAVRTVSKAEIAEKFGITGDFEVVD